MHTDHDINNSCQITARQCLNGNKYDGSIKWCRPPRVFDMSFKTVGLHNSFDKYGVVCLFS